MMTQNTVDAYHDRKSKALYVWNKYRPYLHGRSILDVGADKCYLKDHLDSKSSYWGIGLGGECDQTIDLETGRLPFEEGAFDCVICMEVLEHLEALHVIFDECCRVAKHHVIISLPNAWSDIYLILRGAGYSPDRPLKFYGLPVQKPEDRHRWFYSLSEAKEFIRGRAELNGMQLLRMDEYGPQHEPTLLGRLRGAMLRPLLFRNCAMPTKDLFVFNLWAVLAKPEVKD
jgi:SAM-dependent methyltransferase